MNKQKSSQSSSASGSGQTWAQPYAQNAAQQVGTVYNENQPHLQQVTDMQRNNIVNPLMNQFQVSSPVANQAAGYYGDVIGGKYLNGNPYMGQVTNTLNRNIADQVNSQFEGAGRYGSDAYAGTLARETGAADANLSYNNYNAERNLMNQAASGGVAQNIGTEQAAAGAIGQNAALPYLGSSAYAGSLGQLMSGGTSNSVSWTPNPIWGAIGNAASAASQAAAASDRRLKTKITKVGQFPDGLNVYTFAYKSDPSQMFKGVMADEVKELRPQAYIENYNGSGFAGVNYAAL